MINFEMTGKLMLVKDTDKFKAYEEREFNSGWINRTLNVNCISGDNRFGLRVQGGKFKDEHNDIYVFSKSGVDDNGKTVKGEGFTIPFKERLTHKRLPEVANWKLMVIDLEEPNLRWKLENAVEKSKEGYEFSEDELAELGVKSADELAATLEKSKKKRKEYISEWDYAELIYKALKSDKYKDRLFNIRGTLEMEYSEKTGKWYSHYVPTRIYLAAKDAEPVATASPELFYGSDALDGESVEETGKYFVNAYVQMYDSSKKVNVFAPYSIVIDANDNERKVKKIVDMFTVDDEDEVKQLGVTVDLLDGAQRNEIKLEDLDEELQEDIECGLVDLEDVIREMGGQVYGERITENRFKKLSRGYSGGCQETAYTVDNLHNVSAETEDDSKDLFDEDDDLFD